MQAIYVIEENLIRNILHPKRNMIEEEVITIDFKEEEEMTIRAKGNLIILNQEVEVHIQILKEETIKIQKVKKRREMNHHRNNR